MTQIKHGNKPVHGITTEGGKSKIRNNIFKDLLYRFGILRQPESNKEDINKEFIEQLGIGPNPKETNNEEE